MEEMVEQIKVLLNEGDNTGNAKLKEYLNSLNISDVEELIDELPEHGPLFIEVLVLNRAVNVFRILDFRFRSVSSKNFRGKELRG